MPTYETMTRFNNDLHRLTPAQRQRFRRTVNTFVHDLRTGGGFRPGLRVKQVSGFPGIYELTWSAGTGPAGRATWQYGTSCRTGHPHVIWRRIGGHDILTGP
ncbi:hypothetical protein ACFWIA_28625 [Streptomyces sp. NPDC127068]|uniref:hypothetical protein n=1 Tax=Streptomyces sp. NPDC127068 TaxID=3347127 RepID=UPI003657AEB4